MVTAAEKRELLTVLDHCLGLVSHDRSPQDIGKVFKGVATVILEAGLDEKDMQAWIEEVR